MVTTWIPLHMPTQVPLLVILGLVVATAPGIFTPRLPRNSFRARRRTPRVTTTPDTTPAETTRRAPAGRGHRRNPELAAATTTFPVVATAAATAPKKEALHE